MLTQFSIKTQEELKYYVYALIDPRDNKIFYIGKGISNRVFAHMNAAITNPDESEKLDTIRAIHENNQTVKHMIIRHGLEENEAYILESVLIDFLTYKDFAEIAKITNLVSGHHSFNRGIKTVDECEILYNCKKLDEDEIKHKILVININKSYDDKRKKRTENQKYLRSNIYEATRGWWVLSKDRAEKVEYVLSEYRGVIRAIFKPEIWLQDIENRGLKRWGFEGSEVLDKEILDLYMNKEVKKEKGMSNPVRFLG